MNPSICIYLITFTLANRFLYNSVSCLSFESIVHNRNLQSINPKLDLSSERVTTISSNNNNDNSNEDSNLRLDERHGMNQQKSPPSPYMGLQTELTQIDYYKFRHTVASGIKDALRECRELYRWDRWNCPHRPFIDILVRKQLPANKEIALVRAFTAASIVLSMTRACGFGNGAACGCDASRINVPVGIVSSNNLTLAPIRSNLNELDQDGYNKQIVLIRNKTDEDQVSAQFAWQGCDESVHFAFDVAKMYLDAQEHDMDPTNKLINEHNYRAGRLAVKRNAKRICKCHGISGSCQISTCWIGMPSARQVGDYLRRIHRTAIKVGASIAHETDPIQLKRELDRTKSTKMVFVDASPDYCYENPQQGINGTLGRYCVKDVRHDPQSSSSNALPGHPSINSAENNSCQRLCTSCGYRIKKEIIQVEVQCDCRFKFCCTVECRRCIRKEVVYKCAKHGH